MRTLSPGLNEDTAAPVSLTIADPLSFERLDLEYDTGIR